MLGFVGLGLADVVGGIGRVGVPDAVDDGPEADVLGPGVEDADEPGAEDDPGEPEFDEPDFGEPDFGEPEFGEPGAEDAAEPGVDGPPLPVDAAVLTELVAGVDEVDPSPPEPRLHAAAVPSNPAMAVTTNHRCVTP